MVAGKVLRWSPWAPSPSPSRKPSGKNHYRARIRAAAIDGLSPLIGAQPRVAAIGIHWKGPPPSGGIAYLRRRGKNRSKGFAAVSREAEVGSAGRVDFAGSDPGNEFENDCWLSGGSGRDPKPTWEVALTVLLGYQDEVEGENDKKLAEIGSVVVNLEEWVLAFHKEKQEKGVEGRESQVQAQRKQLPIRLRKDGSFAKAMLYVDASFVGIRTSEEIAELAECDELVIGKKSEQEESSDGQVTDDSSTFDPDNWDLHKLLQLADEEEKTFEYKSRNRAATSSSSSSGNTSPELQFRSASKRRFLSWRKSRKSVSENDDKEGGIKAMQPLSSSSNILSDTDMNKESSGSDQDWDPIGSWRSKEFISRDKLTKIKTQTFFASFDQRDESAGGESACTALVAVIADTLCSKRVGMPTRDEFDALIKEGSSEWRKLCENSTYIERFPNKHFDLDTILESKIRSISVSSDKSFIGFFQPESFDSLRGAMSFDDIWKEITVDVGGHPKVYIVSWNDHFFVLKVESDAYYIIDTLGERLSEGCNKAYMLRFDDSTEVYKLPQNTEDAGEELICSGKQGCREFIKRFLAAIPLREELELEEKGKGNATIVLHQRLQIEFHFTEAVDQVVHYDVDWL